MVLIDYKELKKSDENLSPLKITFTHKMPSERFKRRYFLLTIEYLDSENIHLKDKKSDVVKNLRYVLKNFLGIFDFSLSHFFILNKSIQVINNKIYLIIKISNKYIEKFKSSLFFFRTVNKNEIKAESIFVSGSLKKVLEHLNKY